MDLIGGLVVFFVLVSFIFIRTVINRTNKSRYKDNLVSDDAVNQEIKSRLLRYLALFGMTITSGMAFIGLLTLVFLFTTEARITGNFMDDVFPFVLSFIGIIVGILGTIGIVRIYRKL
jgi:hypothetical protein